MPNIKIYEVKSSATDNYHQLKSKDGLHFFWNDAKFTKNESGDLVFIVCRGAGEALFTKLAVKDIPTTYNSVNNTTHFNHNHNSYTVRGQWERFVRFDIIERKTIPNDWNWQTQLGSSELYDLWKEGLAGESFRTEKIDDLEKIFQNGEAFSVLESCRENLDAISKEGRKIENINEILAWEGCQKIMGSQEFYFSKAKDVYNAFIEFNAEDAFYDKVLADYNTKLQYQDFIEQFKGTREYDFYLIMGKLIAYMDSHGANKNLWNEYEDKRVLASAGIWQYQWISNLVRFKKAKNDFEVIAPGVRNSLEYLKDPSFGMTIVSEDHKEMISEKILLKSYNAKNFVVEVNNYFDHFYGILLANELNRTRLYSVILYHPTVTRLWKDSIGGLAAIDPGGWMEDLIFEMEEKEYGVIWWSKSPTGTTSTLSKLRKKIKDDKSFEFYYIVDGLVRYKAVVVDFATAGDYSNKGWNLNDDVAWYQNDFKDYKSPTQSAAIAFLIEKFEKLDQPFPIDNFKWYGNYSAPRRDNLQPFEEVVVPEPTEVVEEKELLPVAQTLNFNDKYREVLMAIKTKPFILLAGISGTGKSRLVRTLAYKTCTHPDLTSSNKPGNFELIKVRPNWHDSMELLGYESRISGKLEYIVTDFLRFIVKAWQYPDVPFFLCLDEMNLAPVEQYFAEYLSILETRQFKENVMTSDSFLSANQMAEYSARDTEFLKKLGIENKPQLKQQFLAEGLTLPSNLIVMGTVNMDETTHAFSRKVLDRAMTLEMNEVDLSEALETKSDDWSYSSTPTGKQYILGTFLEGYQAYSVFEEGESIISFLKNINRILEGSPFKIAYRVRDEVLIYCYYNSSLDELPYSWLSTALDEVIVMKVLSRIEGDESKVRDVIDGLLEILTEDNYPKCNRKLLEMKRRLLFGYTSYWS